MFSRSSAACEIKAPMCSHLFLEGPSGVGKTTLLLAELGPLLSWAGGFVTRRLLDENANTRAFSLTSPDFSGHSSLPYAPDAPNIFLERDGDRMRWQAEVFIGTGLALLASSAEKRLILLDEFGGAEILLDAFHARLLEVLNGGVPCIGVLKSTAHAMKLARTLGLPEEYLRRHRELREALLSSRRTRLFSVTTETRREAGRLVRQFLLPYHNRLPGGRS